MEAREIRTMVPSAPSGEVAQAVAQMTLVMRGMADMIRSTNERMAALEQQVRLLTKVTPMQANEINAAIRLRAGELCASYRAPGCEKAVGNAIRREMRLTQGVQSMRDIPRCEYAVALNLARIWDDHKEMKAIRARAQSQM